MDNMKNGERLNAVAAGMWMDNSIGAMITYLRKMGLYDDTMIIFLNDHGMLGKFTLFEQGTRVMQIIRYPPLFEGGSVMPNNFITSTADLADIIFELTNTHVNESYVTDSINWMQDAIDLIANDTINYDHDIIGQYRFADFYNSHAIFTERYKYIWRPNSLRNTESGANYPHSGDLEQLYDLKLDGAETNNIINHPSLHNIVHRLRQIMTDYVENVACAADIPCKVPTANHTKVHNKQQNKKQVVDEHIIDDVSPVNTKWSWLKYLVM